MNGVVTWLFDQRESEHGALPARGPVVAIALVGSSFALPIGSFGRSGVLGLAILLLVAWTVVSIQRAPGSSSWTRARWWYAAWMGTLFVLTGLAWG